MRLFLLITTGLCLLTTTCFACKIDGTEGIMPPNNLMIPVDSKSINGMTKRKFSKIINRVKAVYNSQFEEMGGRLIVKKKWSNGTVNAYAEKKGNRFYVTMYGGLARHEVITDDAFALVVCHEFGHHLGGAPRLYAVHQGWNASNEGQADYFGAQKCLKRVFTADDNQKIISQMNIPKVVKQKCHDVYSTANDIAICQRVAMAGYSLANLFRVMRDIAKPISFSTPDINVVHSTYHLHPKPQCRLDTYLQGSLCDRDNSAPVDWEDHRYNYCNSDDGDIVGLRPRCWFNPERYHF